MGDLLALTARQVLGRRRTILMVLAAMVPVLVAIVYQLSGRREAPGLLVGQLVDGVIVATLLPLVALVFGTSVIGSEIDDGTIIYLLTKPIPRWWIVIAKLVVSVLVTAIVCVVATLVSGFLVHGGTDGAGEVVAGAIGVAWGALLYSCIAVALSVVTGRALIVGLLYVYIWEGVVAGLFVGTRMFSVRQYALGLAGNLDHALRVDYHLDLQGSILPAVIVAVVAVAVAIARLRAFEIGERG